MDPAAYLLRLRLAQRSFGGYVSHIHPEWERPRFHDHLIGTLDDLEKDALGCNNVLVTMPPRHSKSTLTTVLFPSYFMARDPRRFTMSCSYNAELAVGFGQEVRELVSTAKTQQAFPDINLHPDYRAASSWRTQAGGRYNAVGIGGTTSGRPANLLILDDPIKARKDAEKAANRNETWSYYTSALATRLEPTHDNRPPKQVIVLTRWHSDDVAGRLMDTPDWEEGLWHHVNFKAITSESTATIVSLADLPKDHPLWLGPTAEKSVQQRLDDLARAGKPTNTTLITTRETALWPERFPLDVLKRKERLNPHDFASLYQQEPYMQGGNLIRDDWWATTPEDFDPNSLQTVIIAVDTAFKASEKADFSVFMVLGMDAKGDVHILHVMRGRWDYPDLKQALIQLNAKWRGRGLRAVYIEDKASGMSIIQDLKRTTSMSIIAHPVKVDKVTRVQTILPMIEAGRVHLPASAPWLSAFMEETVTFPQGQNDDQVDVLSMGLDILSRTSVTPDQFLAHMDVGQSLQSMISQRGNAGRDDGGSNLPGRSTRTLLDNNGANRNSPFGKSLASAMKSSGWSGWGQ